MDPLCNQEKYYLSSNLFIEKAKLYFENIDSKDNIKINERNMFKYLAEYGWEKLPLQWRRKLKDTKFLLLECGSDGNCLFHVISEALNNYIITCHISNSNYSSTCKHEPNTLESDKMYDVSMLRSMAAECITTDNFEFILETYKMETDTGDFFGEWDPNLIENIEDLKTEILKPDDNFWGDHTILQLLGEKLKINFIIFNSPLVNDCSFYNSDLENLKFDKTMLIYYDSSVHFNLIGYFDGNLVQTLFNKDSLHDIKII